MKPVPDGDSRVSRKGFVPQPDLWAGPVEVEVKSNFEICAKQSSR